MENNSPPQQERLPEIRIYGVPPKTMTIVSNAAKYFGVKQSDFLKMKLGELLDLLPQHIKDFQELPS